jgi:ArsR family transcriptional regulator
MDTDERRYIKYFKAFGDPTRQKILRFLTSGEKTVNEIARAIKVSQPTASRHLSILKEAGAVADRREAQKIYYRLEKVSIRDCCVEFCDCLAIIPIKAKETKKGKKRKK